MAKKQIKVQAHENLTDSNIEKVIEYLSLDKPITKKEACDMLNINYNTTRLATILSNYEDKKAYAKKRRDQNRGKPASEDEIRDIVQAYVQGEGISNISKSLFRSTAFVQSVVSELGIPRKVPFEERVKPALLPDECVAESFEPGEPAWSAMHHSSCEIISEVTNMDYEKVHGSKCYKIYIYEAIDEPVEHFPTVTKGGYTAFAAAHELGSLKHLLQYGIKL